MKEINDESFADFVRQPVTVLLFSSPWCTSCKKILSPLEGLSRRLEPRVAFGTCDISENPSAPSRLQVFSVPTVVIFKDGQEVKRFQGPVSEATLSKALEAYL